MKERHQSYPQAELFNKINPKYKFISQQLNSNHIKKKIKNIIKLMQHPKCIVLFPKI